MDTDAAPFPPAPSQARLPARRLVARMALMLALSVLFGAAMSGLKGNGSGVRDAIGNMSAPWLLVPFLAGAAAGTRRIAAGAAVGLAATLAALAGFYVANSVVLDLGPHPWLTDLGLTMRAGVFWAERGLLSGPVFGALGTWWRRDRSLAAAAVIAAMFVAEPGAWWLRNRSLGGAAAYPVPGYPALWLSEILLGLAGFAALRSARRRRPMTQPGHPGHPGHPGQAAGSGPRVSA